MAVLSAAAFAWLAARHLDAPGLYYDEAHQVPAVFAWLGGPPGHFCRVSLGGGPWLTMPYSGAIKSAAFALLLQVSGAEFSVGAWRAFGIALVVGGWIGCVAAVGVRWGAVAQAALAALLLTDVTVLLTTRHDWGPTALALLLRCAFLAVWVRADRVSGPAAFALGAITGVAIFEKLSSVVLLGPLAIALVGAPWRHVALAVLGLGCGALSLALVNAASWLAGDGLISLSAMVETRPRVSWPTFTGAVLSLGQGDGVRRWVLDLPVPRPFVWAELLLMAALLALAATDRRARRPLLAYGIAIAALLLLPRRTQEHHWIIGTPFQYVAIAIVVAHGGARRGPARLLLALLLLLRMPGVLATEAAIGAHRTSARFDPEYTRVARALAQHEEALLVAATWGIGNQIVAHGGAPRLIEPIYNDRAVDAFAHTLAASDVPVVYLAVVPQVAHLFPARTARIVAMLEQDARWREVDPEPELRHGTTVRVRRFIRR